MAERLGRSPSNEMIIRRGLQIIVLVGITALGAAPCFGQYTPPANFPAAVTLSGVPPITYQQPVPLDVNGYYVAVSTSNNATTTFVRYNEDGQNAYRVRIDYTAGGNPVWAVRLFNAAENALPIQSTFNTVAWPSSPFTAQVNTAFTGGVAGTATWVLHAAPLNDYQLAFPDWSAAGVKIPLGFGLGLAMWASFLALGVPIRWVKELTNAAT